MRGCIAWDHGLQSLEQALRLGLLARRGSRSCLRDDLRDRPVETVARFGLRLVGEQHGRIEIECVPSGGRLVPSCLKCGAGPRQHRIGQRP
jgi:hypothetical protein